MKIYDNRHRFGKGNFSDSRCGWARQSCVAQAVETERHGEFFANLEPCLIGMEACGSGHYWARKLGEYGHTAKLMAPQFVKPYVKTNKPVLRFYGLRQAFFVILSGSKVVR